MARKPEVTIKSRVITDPELEDTLDRMWPGSWPKPSGYLRHFIIQFARGCVRAAEDRLLNKVDVPRWSEFHDRETLN